MRARLALSLSLSLPLKLLSIDQAVIQIEWASSEREIMWLSRNEKLTEWQQMAAKVAAETTLPPPFATRHSHSIV